MASKSRRITYLYMDPVPSSSRGRSAPLLVQPETGERRRAVAVVPAHGQGPDVAQVRLPDQDAVVVRHPHPEHLIEFAIDDLLRDHSLLGLVRRLTQLRGQLVDDG